MMKISRRLPGVSTKCQMFCAGWTYDRCAVRSRIRREVVSLHDSAEAAVPHCVILLRLSVVMASNCARFASAAAALLLLLAGCGGGNQLELIPVRGTVTYNGKPLSRGVVNYVPTKAGAGRSANGPIQADGTFVMTTQKRDDGVARGTYNIVIYSDEEAPIRTREEIESQRGPTAKPKLLIPEKYVSLETSGLSDVVDDNHSGFKKIELND
jgi:hypothetical protein